MNQDGPNDPFLIAGKPTAGKIPNEQFFRGFELPSPLAWGPSPPFRDLTDPDYAESEEFFHLEAPLGTPGKRS